MYVMIRKNRYIATLNYRFKYYTYIKNKRETNFQITFRQAFVSIQKGKQEISRR